MANTKRVQFRRGTAAEHQVFTGAEGEVTVNTTNNSIHVHNGISSEGFELARKDFSNVGIATINGTLDVTGNVSSGSLVVSGISSFGGSAEFVGVTSSKKITIGSGNTDLAVDGSIYASEILYVGSDTQNRIELNGNNKTVTAESAIFNQLNVTGEQVQVASVSKTIAEEVAIGSTIITLDTTNGLLVGDKLSAGIAFTSVPIVEIGSSGVGTYYSVFSTTSLSTSVSIGSTVIGVSTDFNITTSNYISVAGFITNAQIVGITTDSLPSQDVQFAVTGLATAVSAGSTIFPLSNSFSLTTGDKIEIADQLPTALVTGLSTVIIPAQYVAYNNTAISTTVTSGSTVIGIANSTSVGVGSFFDVGGYFEKVEVTGVGTLALPTTYSAFNFTAISTAVSAGSTIITVNDISGVNEGDAISVENAFNNIIIVGFTTVAIGTGSSPAVLIGAGDTVGTGITVGTGVTFLQVANPFTYTVSIGAGDTIAQEVPVGTAITFYSFDATTAVAALIGAGDTVGLGFTATTTVSLKRIEERQTAAILIGAGDTSSSEIPEGTSVSYENQSQTRPAVFIGAANTSSVSVSAGATATFSRTQFTQSQLNIENINSTGISTFEQLIIGQVRLPSVDGLKGQVLITDGAGNVAFGTGGGSGGAEVILRVSANTGSDDNDGKILPVRTIKKATQIASKVGRPVTVFVETGEYVEDNPIIVYDSVSVIGDSLRNIVVRPLNAGKDLFKVRNGCYISGMSFNDYIDVRGVPQHTYDYSISFDDPYDTNIDRTGYACTNTALAIVGATYDNTSGFTTFTTADPHELAREYSVKLTGIGWTCGYDEVGISTFVYDNVSGVSTITFFSDALFTPTGSGDTQKGYVIGDKLYLNNLPFSCGAEHAGVTTTIFPYTGLDPVYGSVYPITGINTAAKTVTIAGAASTIPHIYEGYSTVAISTFSYDHVSGIATAVTSTPHGFDGNDRIALAGLEFSCAAEHAGITTTIFPDGTITAYSPDGYTFRVANVIDSTTFEYYVGVSTIAHTYETGGTVQKVPTVQEVWYYPDYHKDGQTEFGVVATSSATQFTIRGQTSGIKHYYTQGGTLRLTRPIINKSPYIQNCSILSSLGGNGILVDGDKVATVNKGIVPELGEVPVVGDQPEFGKSMVAATFTMISFGGIGWRTINDGYAQVVSCFQIFCRYGSLTQSGGYLSITNSATNFGDKALRSTGFSRSSFRFDRGRIVANGTQDGLQTLRVVGLGRSDQELYVLRFINNDGIDGTANFKPLLQFEEFTIGDVNTTSNVFTIPAHPFTQGESVVYSGNEDAQPKQVLDGLVNDASYYVDYIDASNFRLFEDDSLTVPVDVSGSFSGVGTFTKNNQEFFNYEIIEAYNNYQKLTLVGLGTTANFVSGRAVTQGSATGYAVTYSQTTRELVVSVEAPGGVRNLFVDTADIQDHSSTPITVGVSTVVGLTTYWSMNFKLDSTTSGNTISGINSLTENYQLHFHRPSIINSSAHTWEYAGSGTDYNALPQNGGQGKPGSEQVSELGGRVYASGTNELGDFKIGTQITAYNRTGNIIFNNKVTIGELASIRLSLSGGVAVEEFSTDTGLGDNETGGAQNTRVSTQLAVKSFLSNRLGSFIDKQVSTNAVPNAVVQLNAQGQINADLIPPQVVTYNLTNVGGGKTVLVNEIPARNILQGDTVVEPDDSFVLVNDVLGQYLILDNSTADYTFSNGDVITSSLTESVTGIVTTPPNGIGIGTQVQDYVGYGSTGLVKGVLLNLSLTNNGSGYSNPGIYTAVTLTTVTGAGQSAYGTVTIGAGGSATTISAFAGGRGYVVGDILSVADASVGGRSGGAQLQATISEVETRLYLELTNNQKFAGSVALPDYISDDQAVSISTSLTSDYVVDIDPTSVDTGGSIDFANDRIVVGSNHEFGNGDPIVYDANGGSMIAASGNGILNLNTYYTKTVGISSVELYYDYSLVNKLDLSGSGIGTHKIKRQTVNTNVDKIVFVNHGFATGDPFRVSGAAPTGITTNEFYYIGAVTANAFTLHETQADALLAVNGVSFNPVGLADTSVGIMTMTNQNIRYSEVINTSSQDVNNYALLARDSIDASNIVSGVVSPTRLGSGTANDFTFLSGDSSYKKVTTSIGIGTTEPMSATSTSATLAPGGIGTNFYFGDTILKLNRVDDPGVGDFSTLGVSRFKRTTFSIGSDGEIQIKAGAQGDVDAAAFQGQGAAYYLNSANHTGAVPVTRGGTGQNGVPADGAILIGNGSAYNLTINPIFRGDVGITSTTASTSTTTGALKVTGGVGIGGDVYIGGTLNAISKSFLIDHPTKPGHKLQYGSLEGPENGVYVRGRLTGSNTIELPDYWTELVDENTITVSLTPIGQTPCLHSVVEVSKNNVVVASECDIDCYYVVYGERKDIDKLEVEFKGA